MNSVYFNLFPVLQSINGFSESRRRGVESRPHIFVQRLPWGARSFSVGIQPHNPSLIFTLSPLTVSLRVGRTPLSVARKDELTLHVLSVNEFLNSAKLSTKYRLRVKLQTLITGVACPSRSTDTLSTDRMTLSAVTTVTPRLAVLTVAARRAFCAQHSHAHWLNGQTGRNSHVPGFECHTTPKVWLFKTAKNYRTYNSSGFYFFSFFYYFCALVRGGNITLSTRPLFSARQTFHYHIVGPYHFLGLRNELFLSVCMR